MNFFGGVRCVTGKNWLDFGGDADLVTLGLGLGLGLQLSESRIANDMQLK